MEKVYLWQSYKGRYSVSMDKVYVDNQTGYSFLLNDYYYQKRQNFRTPPVKLLTIWEFPPHSFEMIGGMPDFILQEPPMYISVRRKRGDKTPKTVRVLEVKNSVHNVFIK